MTARLWNAIGRALARRGTLTEALLPLVRCAPPADARLQDAFERYIREATGDRNDDPRTNGELRMQKQLLPQCRVAFDVGANRGDWTASAIAVNPQLVVHCFEPCRSTFDDLSAREFPSTVRRNPVGLGAGRRDATLFLFDGAPALNSLYQRQGLEDGWGIPRPERQETVELIGLDEYCEEQGVATIDYLKLDAEGHELDVLKGGSRLFESGRVKYGQFEYGGCNIDSRVLLRDLFAWLQAAGYQLFKLLPDRLRPVPRYDQRLENFQYQNWVFARRDLPLPGTDGI